MYIYIFAYKYMYRQTQGACSSALSARLVLFRM